MKKAFVLILIVTALCYGNSLRGQFIGDDYIVVVSNRLIKSVGSLPTLFVKNYWGDGYTEGLYRPLTNLSYALDYALGGLDPRVYHITNLLLHALNSLLVFWLARYYTGKRLLALFTALLFAA